MDFSKETILIVDDSSFQRTVIKSLFSEYFNFLEAASGGECMRMIQENASRIDLVLLDLVMPGIDGMEVLRRRQSMQEFMDIPIIVLTTSESHAIQADAYELGANDFLIKPIDEFIALSRIQNLLKSKRRMKLLIEQYIEYKVKSELDAMTGLFNKITLINLVSDILLRQPNKQHALLVIDIDNFKAINDVYGHTVGDHTISVITNLIVSQFNDTEFVGRIGGDEFVVFVQNTDSKESIYEKTASLIHMVAQKENLSIPKQITLSIGLAFSDGTEQDYAALFLKADEALYAAKNSGKSCYHEYGIHNPASSASLEVYALTNSRNVLSMLEFSTEAQTSVKPLPRNLSVSQELLKGKEKSILYIDISEEADNGKSLLDSIAAAGKNEFHIILICHEGSMEQIRLAASYAFTQDILLAPLEATTLHRRVKEHLRQV